MLFSKSERGKRGFDPGRTEHERKFQFFSMMEKA